MNYQVAGFNGLSDALRRLDFCSAVHDHRRFPYTAKLLELLLSQQRITTLSGCAQKSVLNVLEEIAVEGLNFFKNQFEIFINNLLHNSSAKSTKRSRFVQALIGFKKDRSRGFVVGTTSRLLPTLGKTRPDDRSDRRHRVKHPFRKQSKILITNPFLLFVLSNYYIG